MKDFRKQVVSKDVFIEPLLNLYLIEPALRVPWPQLDRARRDYSSWRSLILWSYAVSASLRSQPAWLLETVAISAPAFIEYDVKHSLAPRNQPVYIHLERWLNEVVFAHAKREGWFDVVLWYIGADPFSQRLEAYARYCRKAWRRHPPASYPLWPAWREEALRCSSELLKGIPYAYMRKLVTMSPSVAKSRLDRAVRRYVEWEIFSCWARTALKLVGGVPVEVARELRVRCPGFIEEDETLRKRLRPSEYEARWERLIQWIHNHRFQSAKREGWSNLLVYCARLHPRLQRVMAYWVAWDSEWCPRSTAEYPQFERWRRTADDYVTDSYGSDDVPG